MPKSAIEKLNVNKEPHVVSPIPEGFPGSRTANSMIVSTPREVDAIMQRIPRGNLVTLDEIRAFLARRHGTDIACPVSTAIFINIAARAAEEMLAMGIDAVTPYWRVLKSGGKLNDKYPGGAVAQKEKLEAEGFSVVQQKKEYLVADYQDHLFSL
jgi:alkylated DNA nucleotide flippase Atl1